LVNTLAVRESCTVVHEAIVNQKLTVIWI
jgi:hypothetical protein